MALQTIARAPFQFLVILVASVVCQEAGASLDGIQQIFNYIHSWAEPTTYAPPISPYYDNQWGTGLCDDECTCGIPNRMTRIIGGAPTRVNEYPWVAALTKNGRIFCGGTLITDRHILTAAHCVDKNILMMRMTTTIVLAGHFTMSVIGEPSLNVEKRGINSVIRHPNFRPRRGSMDNDIAIITLSSPVQFSAQLSPACLPSPGEDFANLRGTVAGWGRQTEKGIPAPELLAVNVPILTQQECYSKSVYDSSHLTENMMCAGKIGGGSDSCQGDSGGPLVVTDRMNRSVAAGIVSWGEGCGRPYRPGVYTRVNHYLTWIQVNTKEGCFCG